MSVRARADTTDRGGRPRWSAGFAAASTLPVITGHARAATSRTDLLKWQRVRARRGGVRRRGLRRRRPVACAGQIAGRVRAVFVSVHLPDRSV